MKQAIDLARVFLSFADRDMRAFATLANDPASDDETIGFHAQQAVEKCLKAVLIRYGVDFRKTHALDELIDLLAIHDKTLPPHDRRTLRRP